MIINWNLGSCVKMQYKLISSARHRTLPVRQIHKSIKWNAEAAQEAGRIPGHKPDKWDKRMLVWTKKYPNVEAIPPTVSSATMDKTRNQVRIRVNIILCIMTGVVSFIVYQYGKRQTLAGGGMFSQKKSPSPST